MNKKSIFLISNLFFVSLIVIVSNYLIVKLEAQAFFIPILLTSIIIYFIINKPLVDELFIMKEELKEKLEQTMHEINTPVSTIQINSEMLSSSIHEPKNKKRLQNINKACLNLLSLYEDMEYYIKQEVEDISFEYFDLHEQVKISLQKQEDLLHKKNIKTELRIEPYSLYTDKSGFEITMDNLISNAIIHNASLTTLEIYTRESILYIKDDGNGIKSQNIYQVFDKYYKADYNAQGFGIGLHLVKKFCDAHAIKIKIDSSKNGTIFCLDLKNILHKQGK